ncbi:MAG: histidine phosphatase family protein [Lachnospiraceae bacterium]
MKLYLVRHGETDGNKRKLLQGHSDIPLNDFGRTLAYKTGQGLQHISFDAVFTSPLKRAKETAEIIINKAKIPFIVDDRIQEMGFGIFEGLCCSKEGWEIPDPEFGRFFTEPQQYHAPLGGEGFPDVLKRVKDFFEDLYSKEQYAESNLLISTHGATLRAMLDYFKNVPLENFWDGGVHRNCAVSIVEVNAGSPQVLEEGLVYYDDIVDEW